MKPISTAISSALLPLRAAIHRKGEFSPPLPFYGDGRASDLADRGEGGGDKTARMFQDSSVPLTPVSAEASLASPAVFRET